MNPLIDQRSVPTLRERIGRLLATCHSADIAVSHIRMTAVDLTDRETVSVTRARILLARLEARALGELGPDHGPLRRFLESGRVQVRSAGIGAWTPDFSIYRGSCAGDVCLVGAHWFREPVVPGPAFTAVLTDPESVATALRRFDELWRRGHDVLEPVIAALARGQSFDAT